MASAAWAKSWCAAPLVAHEWGVHLVRVDGVAPRGAPLPSWFHEDGSGDAANLVPVWALPPDNGIRDLPVVQFHGFPGPVAVEVGFGADEASAWWPAVDRRIAGADARSPDAIGGRERLLLARDARNPLKTNPPIGSDPTKQLGWDALALLETPTSPRHPAEQPWVDALRRVPTALWVDTGTESDRFLFYEADTASAPDLVLERGDSWSPTHPHHLVRNRSPYPVHDVIVIADGRAWTAPQVPAGATAGFLLDQPLDRAGIVAWLGQRWVDPAGPPTERWTADDCVMMRDPAIPVDTATGHRLYAPELDVLLSVWADRMLATDGARLVYREDPAALDARMPLAVYTDMYHWVQTSRLGVVMVEGGF